MKKFAVLGSGINYTLSPVIHNTVFAALGINAKYGVEDIPENAFAKNIPGLLSCYDGLNVTKPFKKLITQYLETECDAVNTVLCAEKKGFNTDGFGFMRAINRLTGESLAGANVLLLGSGGAAEVAAAELIQAGTNLTVYNRTAEKAVSLATKLGCSCEITSPPDIIINCTSAGLDGVTNPLPIVSLKNLKFAYDLIYLPPQTPFLAVCGAVDAKAANGLDMLIYQALKADELFLQMEIDYKKMFDIVMKKLTEDALI